MDFCRIRCSRSSRDTCAGADTGVRFITSAASPESGMPRSRPRRTSPSVTMPSRRPSPSSTSATWMLPLSIAAMASATVASDSNDGFAPGFHAVLDLTVVACARARPVKSVVYRGCQPATSIPAVLTPKSGLQGLQFALRPVPAAASRFRPSRTPRCASGMTARRAIRQARTGAQRVSRSECVAGFYQDPVAVSADHFAGRTDIGSCPIDRSAARMA